METLKFNLNNVLRYFTMALFIKNNKHLILFPQKSHQLRSVLFQSTFNYWILQNKYYYIEYTKHTKTWIMCFISLWLKVETWNSQLYARGNVVERYDCDINIKMTRIITSPSSGDSPKNFCLTYAYRSYVHNFCETNSSFVITVIPRSCLH